ncbi:MAG: hypothetical protein F6K25_32500 [Okeania sp. SIO2G4]|uniref:hypothetical protein n=1 Tax=unclassified Okeania TaxID=2634635 RepID=UPI0013B90007|nr:MULTISPECIES: hypothetical protein [unclassified Okeania]NEP07328.1 hypothetical protein [Okeania sp. SIO4D6]NEP76219.1 hypothetical protein [Okeania sp. SIO2G5]NEP97335.1 hypothetical protein [Okeania sp. SIO2F5]NEQ95075.1 hypothetical protein [Okeania sp. SIO2G4]
MPALIAIVSFIETEEVGRVNPRSKLNSFNFPVPGQKAKSVHVSKLKVVYKKDGYTYTFCQQLSINVDKNAI